MHRDARQQVRTGNKKQKEPLSNTWWWWWWFMSPCAQGWKELPGAAIYRSPYWPPMGIRSSRSMYIYMLVFLVSLMLWILSHQQRNCWIRGHTCQESPDVCPPLVVACVWCWDANKEWVLYFHFRCQREGTAKGRICSPRPQQEMFVYIYGKIFQ